MNGFLKKDFLNDLDQDCFISILSLIQISIPSPWNKNWEDYQYPMHFTCDTILLDTLDFKK